ncbi:hypothetical protein [Jiangella mangrovi]|uniref:Uncharacterized protein n=1 Tax=Jiangella mangrovi TaxID=1524084 RepID=A0A7W9LLN3_9ACTN|nr:hypothetical protein [Jiangella mangrovi]MBB5788383.1 hypothetical protein [Jiangella mangrovi]
MDWEIFGQIVVALLAIGAALLQYQRNRGGPRDEIRQDAELLKVLPEGEARARLLAHVEASVEKLITRESELRRDPPGIVLGVFSLSVAIVIGYFAATGSLPWTVLLWPAAAGVGLFGAIGFVDALQRSKRNAQGRPVA